MNSRIEDGIDVTIDQPDSYTLDGSLNEIKTVIKVSKDSGEYCVKCPHCSEIAAIEGEDLSEIRGEQYQHNACGGWFEITHNAHFVRKL